MIDLVTELAPTVLATQEGLDHQLADLMAGIDDRYRLIAEHRHDGRTEENSAVIHDATLVEPVEVEHRWLSDTPEIPGSRSWGNVLPRMYTLVRFRRRGDGREFVVVATHVDHREPLAQVNAARQLVDRIGTLDPALPVLVMGDFNVGEDSEPYAILTGAGLRDSWLVADHPGPRLGTFNNYGKPDPEGVRIDWILGTPPVAFRSARAVDIAPHGQYPSDHLPVEAVVEV